MSQRADAEDMERAWEAEETEVVRTVDRTRSPRGWRSSARSRGRRGAQETFSCWH